MTSLQTLAERQRTEEEVRSRPRTLVLAHERSLATLIMRHDDAKALIREGLLSECSKHDLHLVEYREWDLDDVERILIAIGRAGKVTPVVWPTVNVVELRKRVSHIYEPLPLPEEKARPADRLDYWGLGILAGIGLCWAVLITAYIDFSRLP